MTGTGPKRVVLGPRPHVDSAASYLLFQGQQNSTYTVRQLACSHLSQTLVTLGEAPPPFCWFLLENKEN